MLGCVAQRHFDGKIEGRNLEWSDFVGKPDKNLSYDAYTKWEVFYTYNAPVFDGDTAKITFKVWRTLSKESWVKKKIRANKSELLKHEQGHYNIAKLCEEELRKAFENHTYLRPDYRYKIDSIYAEVLHKYLQLEKRYDFETDHMYNRKVQEKWNTFFKERL